MRRKSTTDATEDVKKFCQLVKSGVNPIFFDLETTGLDSVTCRILTADFIKLAYTDNHFIEIDRLGVKINPERHIPEEASKVNGITDEDVKGFPTEDEVIYDIVNFLGERPLICGYNSNFDIKFMESLYNRQLFKEFEYCHHLDVMKMVKQKLSLPNNKLVTAAHELGADIGLTAHRSIDDVIMTWRVCELLLPYYKEKKNEDIEDPPIRITVNGARHWQKSHTCNFIFLDTFPKTKISYNIYKKEWKSEDIIDLDDAIQQTFSHYNVANEKDLVKAVCSTAS